MQKTGINSRKRLVEYVKESSFFQEVATLCQNFVSQYEFQNTLSKIKKVVPIKNVVCRIDCGDSEIEQQLLTDLGALGIVCCKEDQNVPVVRVSDSVNYYKIFFDVLRQLVSNELIEIALQHFSQDRSQQPIFLSTIQTSCQQPIESKKTTYAAGIVVAIFLINSFVLYRMNLIPGFPNKSTITRSDCQVPIPQKALYRSDIFTKIDKSFKSRGAIKILVLVGTGGGGKTTLARQYAQMQKASVVWEINAKNKNTALEGFAELAFSLSKTVNEKNELDRIKKIENSEEYMKKLMLFVKEKLKNVGSWFLIFDNLENLANIQTLFPNNVETWGNGKVLVTTRNSHIHWNAYMNADCVIDILPLDNSKKLTLFTKIMSSHKANKLEITDKKKMAVFLKSIPPFPLDVSIAAYFIKNTKISYTEYLGRIHSYDKEFEQVQTNFLREISDYAKTRYGIVTSTIKSLVTMCPEFEKLLLFISVLDAQNIPKNLLEIYSNSAVVNNFIHHMKKYSLITLEFSADQPALSIHRSTHEIIRLYLTQTLSLDNKTKYMDKIIETLEKASDVVITQGDIPKIRTFLRHVFAVAAHPSLLSPLNQGMLNIHIGRLFSHLSFRGEARSYTEKGFFQLKTHLDNKHHPSIARALTYLGVQEKRVGNFKKSLHPLQTSLDMYDNFYQNRVLEKAYTLLTLGDTYAYLGEFDKAKNLLQQSMNIYRAHGSLSDLMRANTLLGEIYLVLGDYQCAQSLFEEIVSTCEKKFVKSYQRILRGMMLLGLAHKGLGAYAKGKQVTQKSVRLFPILLPENHENFSWVLIYLSDLNRLFGLYEEAEQQLKKVLEINAKDCTKSSINTAWKEVYQGLLLLDTGQYNTAKSVLENCLDVHKKTYHAYHPKIGWISHALANVYKFLGDYEKSAELFDTSLNIYACHYGPQHIDYALVLSDFGHFLIFKGAYKKAENLISQAFTILKTNSHIECYRCLEYLGDLYHIMDKKTQAYGYYQQAIAMVKTNFPKGSAHNIRLQNKLEMKSNIMANC